jgi:hypothetical protein
MSTNPLLLHFPVMHSELWPGEPVQGARFLNPGLDEAGEGSYRPDNLPLEGRAAARALGEMLQFGSFCARPADLAYYLAPATEAAGSGIETTRRLTREILQRIDPAARPPAPEEETGPSSLARAQLTLLLAWGLEQDRLESSSIQQKLAQGFESLDLGLSGPQEGRGEDDDDALEQTVVATGKLLSNLSLEDAPAPMDWETALAAMLPFLPEGAVLVTREPAVLEGLAEAGFERTGPDRVRGPGGAAPKAKAFPGPWLERVVEVTLKDEAGESA